MRAAFVAIICLALLPTTATAQRIRIPQTPPSIGAPPPSAAPGTGLAPAGAYPGGAVLGNPNLGAPGFDPFSAAPPATGYPATGYPPPGVGGSAYPAAPYPGMTPYPGSASPMTGYPPTGAAPYPGPAGQPQGIFGGMQNGQPYFPYNQDWLNYFEKGRYLRVVQEFHFRHTWLEGSSANEVDIHDAELGFTLNWPNFLGSGEPLRISPAFIFHFWDGPQPPSAADLPSRAYSTFLSGSWTTPTNLNFGGEVVSSIGVYTDFSAFNGNSLRIKGTGLGWIRLTPNMMFKFGVSYLNRLDIKLLPVGGLYWKPGNLVELELYFPNPKIKYTLPQMGNTELKLYLTGDYGGDTWTIRRVGGFDDQIELSDLRVLGGIEFSGFRGMKGFIEAGYAFDRELLYRITPASSIQLSDSAIVRAGFLF